MLANPHRGERSSTPGPDVSLSLWALQSPALNDNTKSAFRGTTTKREPISNGEEPISHLHQEELRRWNVELRRQLRELDVIGYAITLSQIRRTPKFEEDKDQAVA
jgi:hypothetical protein